MLLLITINFNPRNNMTEYKKLSEVPFGKTVLCKHAGSSYSTLLTLTRMHLSTDEKAVRVLLETEMDSSQTGLSSFRRLTWMDAEDADNKYIPFSEL